MPRAGSSGSVAVVCKLYSVPSPCGRESTASRYSPPGAGLSQALILHNSSSFLNKFSSIMTSNGIKCQRWMVSKAGHLDNMRLAEEDVPVPKPGEILVKVRSCGLNMADVFSILGLYSATPQGAFTPGLEFAGDVMFVGSGCEGSGLKQGDRVMGCTRFGGYATHIAAGVEYVRRIPDHWSYDQGAAFLAQCLTAWYGLVDLGGIRIRRKNKKRPVVLVHSCAGGVGLFAAELVQRLGGTVIGTVGNADKAALLESRLGLKPHQVIVRTAGGAVFREQLHRALAKAGAEGFDVVFDSLLGDYFQPAYEALDKMGQHIVFGAASMTPPGKTPNWLGLAYKWLRRPAVDPLQMISDNKAVVGFNLIWLWDRVEELTPVLDEMMTAWEWTPPHVGHAYAFHEAQAAVMALQSGQTTGKVVLQVAA